MQLCNRTVGVILTLFSHWLNNREK
ncbi:type I toxin-antitoxin system Fst family toxin (plasmid) [Staphylococcus aureus]|nr:type I toxin-antitoxin system Fst family toxin [Staphylococcus aureus]